MCTHRHKRGFEHLPFIFLERKCSYFLGSIIFLFYFYEYMCICICVCFCLRTAFPVKQIQKSKYQVGSGNETLSSSDAFLHSAQARAAQQCSTHRSAHARHRQAETHKSEALPPSPVVFVLVLKWVVINKRLSYPCLEFTANYPKDKRQI